MSARRREVKVLRFPPFLREPMSSPPPSRRGGPKSRRRALAPAKGPSVEERRRELAQLLLRGVAPRDPRIAMKPADTASAPVAREPANTPPPRSLRKGAIGERAGASVLIVDDDADIRDMVVKALSGEHLLYQAAEGKSALALLRRLPSVDVVLCDISMPGVDGLALAKAMKADPDLRAIPIVFMSALDSPAHQVAGIQAGARFYLAKPFKIRDLRAAIARASRRPSHT